MNDRFRFRVWHKETGMYCISRYVENTPIFVLTRLSEERFTIEQCTGLKDKNGRLIYEGDIIELCRGKSNIHQLAGKRFEVKFLTHRFCGFGFGYVRCPAVDMALTESKAKICKVIGNIHEKPELLEDK